jgi:uncharacterized membrane protein
MPDREVIPVQPAVNGHRIEARHHEAPARVQEAIPSKASIAGHPIHPMLIPFPIAFLSAAPVVDVVYWITGGAFWAQTAFYLVIAGVVTGALAALVGMVDFAGVREVRRHRESYWHAAANSGALLLSVVGLVVRAGDTAGAILPWGLVLSAGAALLLVVGGWYGGELAYRFRIGVAPRATAAEHF